LEVSDFAQTPAADRHTLLPASGDVGQQGIPLGWESVMSKADEFRQYAEEAMRWARQSKIEKDKEALLDLARTWTQAASHREGVEKDASRKAA
jgi:hypothetical protein